MQERASQLRFPPAAELARRAEDIAQLVLDLIAQPIGVDLEDGMTVVFSHWFFSDLEQSGTVQVLRGNEVLLEGEIFGPNGAMRREGSRMEPSTTSPPY